MEVFHSCMCGTHNSFNGYGGAGVFSLLKAAFGEQQDMALQDYIEASIMLQYKK